MSEIQRWTPYGTEVIKSRRGDYVLYDDHIESLSRYRWMSADEVTEPGMYVRRRIGSYGKFAYSLAHVQAKEGPFFGVQYAGYEFFRVPEDGGAK